MVFVDNVLAANILQQFWQDCENEELCDVVLIAGSEEQRIPGHRKILSAASEYFKVMFQSSMRESRTKEIEMPSANGAILRCLIEYIYTCRVAITEDNVFELLKLADSLLLVNVVTACGKFLSEQLNPSNCLGLAHIAEQYRCEIFLKKAKDYSLEHFMDVSKTQEFHNLNSEQLGEFLASDNLNVPAEENVFEILMTWIQHDRIEREKHEGQLLKLVRLPLLEPLFFIKQVKPICTSIESHQLYVDALEWRYFPDRKIINASKSINTDKFLMCLTHNSETSRTRINFYCPQRLKWMRCLIDFELYSSRYCVAVMHDNLYVVFCINAKTMTMGQINPMKERRMDCAAAVMNGFIYAVGGSNGNETLNSVEKWDPKANTWSKVANMSMRRQSCGIAQLNDKLYSVGGHCDGLRLNSAEYYDVHLNVWKSIAPMNGCHRDPVVAVANGLLYLVGFSSSVERYDPRSNKWTEFCSLPPICNNWTTLCSNFCNKVIVCCKDQFYEYNDKTIEWKTKEILSGIKNVECIIEYSGALSISEFSEN